MWCGLAKRLDLVSLLKVAIIRKHATLNFAHVSPAHILRTGLASKWCEKAPVLSSQLWTLETSQMSWESFVILWHPELRQTLARGEYAHRLESKRRHFFALKNRYGHGRTGRIIAAGPVYETIQTCLRLFYQYMLAIIQECLSTKVKRGFCTWLKP